MFRKLTSEVCSTLRNGNMAMSSKNNLWKDKIFLKRKGRTPEKIKRFKSSSSKILFTDGKKRSNGNLPLHEPTLYFASKRVKLSQSSNTSDFSMFANPVTKKVTQDIVTERNSPLRDILVALDCEMVQCQGITNSLARCSIVNYSGQTVLDLYIKQSLKVVDYRTPYSGITKELLEKQHCVTFLEAQARVKEVVKGKLIVGHSIFNDFSALEIKHPGQYTIDLTSGSTKQFLTQYRRKLSLNNNKTSLKTLAKDLLQHDIQTGGHCSVEDALSTMAIFKLVESDWVSTHQNIIEKLTGQNESFLDDKYWPSEIINE